MADQVHVFERAGMGVAPYRFAGMVTIPKVIDMSNPPNFPKLEAGLGTCAFCGHAIMNVFVVRSADGTRWGVGSECIHKHGTAGLVKAVKASIRKDQAEKRAARGAIAREELKTLAGDPRAKEIPHSNDYYASQGKTFADEIDFYVTSAGASGCTRFVRHARKVLA